jgi:hypothetical protein
VVIFEAALSEKGGINCIKITLCCISGSSDILE